MRRALANASNFGYVGANHNGRRHLNEPEQTVPERLLGLHQAIVETAPGISSGEYQAFLFIAGNEGVSQRDVREHLDIPQATASRLLANLNGSGHALLECTPVGRHQELRLAPKGRQLLARLAVLLGCACMAPAASGILCQFEVEPTELSHAASYDACLDPAVFTCDVS